MTQENHHLCMERHQLARMEYAVPFISNTGTSSISNIPLPQIIREHITLRSKLLNANCIVCHQNFSLTMECINELSRVCEYRNILSGEPITPDADEEWGKQNSHSFPNPDAQWAELQECPVNASLVNSAPDPNDAWGALQPNTMAHTQSPHSGTLPAAPNPDDEWIALQPYTGTLSAAPDPDAEWGTLQTLTNRTPVFPKRLLLDSQAPNLGEFLTPHLLHIPCDTVTPIDTPGSLWAPQP